MLSAGEVGVVFGVKDDASGALQRIADEFMKIQAIVDAVTAAIDKIGGADGGLLKLQEQLGITGRAGDDAGRTITESFGKIDGAVDSSIHRVRALKDSFAEAAEAARAIQVASSSIGGGGGDPHHGPHGWHAIGSGLGGNVKGMLTNGLGFAFGAEGMAAGFAGYEAFEKAADLDQARTLMMNKGVTSDKIDEAQRMAFSLSPRIGESGASIMKMMADIGAPLNKGVTGNSAIDAAEAHIGTIGDALTVFRSLDGKNGTNLEKQVFDLVKSGELRNAVSSDSEFDHAISAMVQGSIANPKVGPEQWFQFISKARSAGMRADDDWVYKVGPELITEFNAPGGGTAWSSLYQGLVSGKLTKAALGEMDSIHAFDDDPNKVVRDKNGNVVRVHPGAMGNMGDTFTHNPSQGIQMLLDKIDAKLAKDNGGNALDDAARKKGEEDWLTNVFGNRNAAQMALTLAEQQARLGRGAQAADNAATLPNAAANVRNNDPNFAVAQFEAQLSNMAATLGNMAMPNIVTSLQQLGAAAAGAAKFLGMLHGADNATEKYARPLNDLVSGKWGDIWGDTVNAFTPDPLDGRGEHTGPHGVVGPGAPGARNWTPSGIALGGGADNSRLAAAASIVPPNMSVSANVTATGTATATFGAPVIHIDGLGAAVTAAISGVVGTLGGMFRTSSGNTPSSFDGRSAPASPDTGGIGHN
jgi:hypothetical protein